MREVVQVVVWFAAIVIVVGIGVVWGMDAALGIRHINADGAAAGNVMVALHHLPHLVLGGALVWLHHKIFWR